jgi:hypothetical protein
LHRIALEKLVIDDPDHSDRLLVTAAGTFRERPFTIDGVIPSPAQVLDTTRANPFRMTVDSESIKATLTGAILDPSSGKGMDLALHASVTGVNELVEIFDDDIPPLGDLEISARIHGDYRTPRLDEVRLELHRGKDVELGISGEIPDVATGEGMRLEIDGTSGDPQVLSYLLFRHEDRLDSLRLKGVVRKQQHAYFIDGLDAEAVTTEGLKLLVTGTGQLLGHDRAVDRQDATFTARLTASRTTALNLMDMAVLPDVGPVSGSARVAIGAAEIGLYDAEIRAGRERTGLAILRGDVGRIPLRHGEDLSGMKLALEMRAAKLGELGRQLGFDWPELGVTNLSGTLGVRTDRLVLDKARLLIGNPEQPAVKVTGKIWRVLQTGSSLDIDVDVATADIVAALGEKAPGYLGRITGTARLSDIDGSWGLEQISLESHQTRLFNLQLDGRYDDLEKQDQIEIRAMLNIADPAAFADTLGLTVTGIKGPYRMRGRVTGSREDIRYRGNAMLGNSTSTTDIKVLLGGKKPYFSGNLKIPLLHLEDLGLEAGHKPASAEANREAPASEYVFSRKPLDLTYLDDFNLDLAIQIDRVESSKLTIETVSAHVNLYDGRLKVDPLRLVFEGGNSLVSFSGTNGDPPGYRLRVTSDDVQLGPLLAQMEEGVPVNSYSNIYLDLTAKGRSPHELASSLQGKAEFGLENARIPRHYIDLLSVDVFGWILSKSFARESFIDINCVVMAFDVSDGVVDSNVFVADGTRVSAKGKIKLDLGAETMDIVIIPKQKRRIYSSIAPVKLKGPLRDPEVTAIPAKAAIQEVGGFALLPTIYIPLKLVQELWSIVDDGDKTGTGCAGIKAVGEKARQEILKSQDAE